MKKKKKKKTWGVKNKIAAKTNSSHRKKKCRNKGLQKKVCRGHENKGLMKVAKTEGSFKMMQ